MILFFFAAISFFVIVGAETSYECLQNAVQKVENSSCPLITAEAEHNRDENARLYISCTKEQYLNYGCNETQWVHACTRNVADISTSNNNNTLSFKDFNLMWKYCNEGTNDSDYKCFTKVETSIKNEECNILATNSQGRLDLNVSVVLWLACFKTLYEREGCNENEWIRVCNRHIDRFNAKSAGSQAAINWWRKSCTEHSGYNCFKEVLAQMNDTSCPEVLNSKNQNDTAEEIARHQIACYKRFFLTHECDIGDWRAACHLFAFFSKRNEYNFIRKYCNF